MKGAPPQLQSRSSRSLPAPLACLLLLLGILAGCRHQPGNAPAKLERVMTDPLAIALHAHADAGHLAPLHWPDFSNYKPQVWTFYKQRDWEAAWVHKHKPTPQAVALMNLFAMSASKGLNPADYDAAEWQGWSARLPHAGAQQIAAFDMAMTVSAMRYISDLHVGRVNPSHFIFGIDIQAKKLDLGGFLQQQVISAPDVGAALAGVEPDAQEYKDTEKVLVQYQQAAAMAAEHLPAPAGPVSAGAHYAGSAALAARLTVLGDLPEARDGGGTYTQTIADGVKSYQDRNGLPGDGRLTPATIAALNNPLDGQIRQIEDTLERFRWLSSEYQNAPIAVNIPEYKLRAYGDDHKQLFEMRVVVGQAKEEDHKTPVLAKTMKYVVLRPYWVVTPTIIKKEILPHVQADKSYIADKNFEVVDRHTGKQVENWSVAAMAKGMYMVREKPGPTNSLGLIKFMFPNKLNIYLHSTPAVQLFSRSRRDFSHGCVRLQDPEKLADWVLGDQPKWQPDVIHDAMENGEDNKTVLLSHPIPVVILYETARVEEDGKVHFFKDLYGYDADMESVLAKGDPFPVKPEPKKITPNDTE